MKKTKLGEFEELVLLTMAIQIRKVAVSNPVNGLKVE